MKYEAILFDMDGVLIDSEELMTKAGIMALHDFGIEAKPEDFIPFVGRGEDLYIGGVAEKYGHKYVTAMKDSAYAHYGDHVETEAFVPPEIPAILYTLRNLGYKIAVCTSADKVKVVHNLRAMGVTEDVFTAIVTGDRIKNKKPDPEIYLTGAALAGVEPEKCAVVEDAPSGIKAAQAAGMLAVGIDTSFPAEHLMQISHPDRMIHSLNELPGLLEKNERVTFLSSCDIIQLLLYYIKKERGFTYAGQTETRLRPYASPAHRREDRCRNRCEDGRPLP